MFPGGKINPKQLRQMEKQMKKMGMNMKELEGVEQVVITLKDKEIVIKNAEVSIMKAMGSETYQISGDAEERIKSSESTEDIEISQDDVDLVSSQTGKSKEEAEAALKEVNGDLAEAIMRLS
ncbi:MAG: nascent polypeptide-associated complex protein [Methanosphaera sp.]|uniref:nascent polypeptide-associated complex protein n=1 Tax=Methanosphaera sp. ISO3-F5 TaxID=1452353 RepID=UPI002B259709|nr:nascent polypeptide-associated complex protein [Methanosphaera sp. ISO3-F5]MBR0472291.1 nascent polypeptide-associated complex protein [Methanosphaera sp.]WQH65290.1 nascent polypeptide-associated complex protein [Methanosphaera sp. ISO3-F5]